MAVLKLNTPADAKQIGELQDFYDIAGLEQDLVQIQFHNGYGIDVGWYPEHDPSGCFIVTVFLNDWENWRSKVRCLTPNDVMVTVNESIQSLMSK